MKKIATFYSPLKSKFGIPRQSGIVPELAGTIVLEKEFRSKEAVRGLEEFD
ncbi:MAG: tRNA (N6-threonylcarbamoyladenosine(37)-N6)-methyltransferase TrmO, partial [Prevotella sp.]|nr:tRNA (N6-threonylcarbamoyladenosine(37)-N6)-methyltransferase TrmO [Prevotella sp.]